MLNNQANLSTTTSINLQPLAPIPFSNGQVIPSYQDYANLMQQLNSILNSMIQNNDSSRWKVKGILTPAQVGFRVAGRF